MDDIEARGTVFEQNEITSRNVQFGTQTGKTVSFNIGLEGTQPSQTERTMKLSWLNLGPSWRESGEL